MSDATFDQYIATHMPHFIAVNYQRALAAQTPQERVTQILRTYNLGLRVLALGLVSQYLIRDRDLVSDPKLNELIGQKFPHPSLDDWTELFFATLHAYEGNRDLFFIAELYDFYWDTSSEQHRPWPSIRQPFSQLNHITEQWEQDRFQTRDARGWAALADEVQGLLKQVLECFAFLRHYDLIRVTDYDDDSYSFQLHKGDSITTDRRPRPQYLELNRGWFYLQNSAADFLPLHPFLIAWEGAIAASEEIQTEIGVYDHLVYERISYLLTIVGTTVLDSKIVKEFIELLYSLIEEFERRRIQVAEEAKRRQEEAAEEAQHRQLEAKRLTWVQLRDICANMTRLHTAAVRAKYRKELYLQRDKTRRAFETFLESDKRCFVLIGKSGVGKSNFFLALEEQLRESSADICLLMYDGAQLKTEPSITAVISADFKKQLPTAKQFSQDLWAEIAQIEGIERKQVIFCVDAINENQQAKELLRQLDELAREPWDWLKVVFSSRPETWQAIKQGVRLSDDLYYRDPDQDDLGVQLEQFNYSEQLDPFSRSELREAYTRHQQVLGLQTPYEALRGEVRETLRDPLNLWLVAKTYSQRGEKIIPDTLKITELVENYVDVLIASERLAAQDLVLLQQRLAPLMVRERPYRNAITGADITAVGGDLYEIVYDDKVSEGRRRNQSLANLIDAEILVRQVEGRQQKIAFKYERFYEYFVGKTLFETLGPRETWQAQYRDWLAQLPTSPYLWGAVKNCLVQQMRALPAEQWARLCIELAQIPNHRMADVLIAALIEYGNDERERAAQIITTLLNHGRRQFNSTSRGEITTPQCPAWKRVAINAASSLKLGDLITLALTDPSPAVRAVAIRHAFIYWRSERAGGFTILKDLLNQAIGLFGLPHSQIFEALVGLSLLILFYDFKNAETVGSLREIWRRAIEQILWVNPHNLGGRREHVKGWFRNTVLRVVAGFVVRTANEAPSNSALNVPELKRFFLRDGGLERRRSVAQRLVNYLDVTTTDVRDLRDDLLGLAAERDMFVALLANIVLEVHCVAHTETTLPLLKELFDRAVEVDPPGPFCSLVPICSILCEPVYDEENNNAVATRRYMLTTFLDRFQAKWWSNLRMRRFTYLDGLCFSEVGDVIDTPITPLARKYLEQIIAANDYAWMKDIIQWDLPTRAIEAGYFRFAFSAMELLKDGLSNQDVRDAMIELLARMRVYFPDQVDDFLDANGFDEPFCSDVRTRAPSETTGDLLNLRALIFLNEAVILSGSREFWRKFSWVIQQVPESNSLESWLTILFKFVINEIYGEPVFSDVPV